MCVFAWHVVCCCIACLGVGLCMLTSKLTRYSSGSSNGSSKPAISRGDANMEPEWVDESGELFARRFATCIAFLIFTSSCSRCSAARVRLSSRCSIRTAILAIVSSIRAFVISLFSWRNAALRSRISWTIAARRSRSSSVRCRFSSFAASACILRISWRCARTSSARARRCSRISASRSRRASASARWRALRSSSSFAFRFASFAASNRAIFSRSLRSFFMCSRRSSAAASSMAFRRASASFSRCFSASRISERPDVSRRGITGLCLFCLEVFCEAGAFFIELRIACTSSRRPSSSRTLRFASMVARRFFSYAERLFGVLRRGDAPFTMLAPFIYSDTAGGQLARSNARSVHEKC